MARAHPMNGLRDINPPEGPPCPTIKLVTGHSVEYGRNLVTLLDSQEYEVVGARYTTLFLKDKRGRHCEFNLHQLPEGAKD